MFRTLLNLTVSCALLLSSIAHAGLVVESTRYLYKEGRVKLPRKSKIKMIFPI